MSRSPKCQSRPGAMQSLARPRGGRRKEEAADSARPQNAPPKAKYIEHLLIATHSGEAGVGEVFRAMHYRLRDSTWTVVLKGLLTVHLMIREGSQEVTLAYLSKHRNMLAISSFTDGESGCEARPRCQR